MLSCPASPAPACLHTTQEELNLFQRRISTIDVQSLRQIQLLTNSVGRMQVVQALLADWLAVLLVLGWERSADQRARLGGEGGERGSWDGLDSRPRVDSAHWEEEEHITLVSSNTHLIQSYYCYKHIYRSSPDLLEWC